MKTFTFEHEELGIGKLTGVITPENVVQFQSIPYATIPGRFKQSILLETLSGTDRDFTKPGPASPQTFPSTIHDGGPHPDDGDPSTPPSTSEFNCLILNLNVPLSTLTSLSSPTTPTLLPILLYIHGGGFILGRIDAAHNTAYITSQSLSSHQPTITASIQYRLGALGSLYLPSDPSAANRCLYDQRNALLWMQRFVRGFGGDAGRVTLFGESAGALSICAHMLSRGSVLVDSGGSGKKKKALFNRVVLMSGVLGPATMPVSVGKAEEVYEEFMGRVGVRESGEEGLRRVREEVAVERIVEVTREMGERGTLWWPTLTEGWFGGEKVKKGGLTWDTVADALAACEWVDGVVLGCTGFEGTSSMDKVSNITPRDFLAGIQDQLGPESAALISKAYQITPDMDPNLFITRAMRWWGDVLFDAPTHALSNALSRTNKKTYRYIFTIRNPFPSHPLYQLSHHWVDIYFVFKTFHFRYPSQRLKDLSTRHAQLWVEFANGEAPWRAYDGGEGVVMVADERDGWVERRKTSNSR
ncbi:alpha/beta-hydrolase [Periconia macrospinosa]|uniref:Carboxylic ester hydrolase n=1 Tax=Periconia macrospinosa TaxID=97972 RepID=A0A2V1DCN1_9PLEO|nr:alpha/beta-hydrolase [Periconia macrospinosa]